MSNFFHPDTPIMQFLSRLFDRLVISALFVLCSLPIVTIGASAAALYTCSAELFSSGATSSASFFFALRQNMKKALPAWVFALAAASLFVLNFRIIRYMPSLPRLLMTSGNLCLLFCLTLSSTTLFPLISCHPQAALHRLISRSLLIGIAKLPKTAFLVLLTAFPFVLVLLDLPTFFALGFLWLFFWPALISWAAVKLLAPIFRQPIPL